ncbi:Sec-dependent nitrous-oxide reductase [Desulfitobacterium chlororespirans]|uniref:Nitrous oxide reductase apoprotein n=1 Tax=Desulfitobacterium chlororespirans DSM 11544 TaxID=1121395 RepID=A0A1M7UXF7_9FIRM|nr:Sec-dependent nitrous-oxide reductase [Desulfitobacterium chlororespirans]SHN87659.1 nitrous oxide reductase apoprotein [Desulfitobacterium chlororespirans DSM 11544]
MEKGLFKKIVLSLAGLLVGLVIAVYLSAQLNPEAEAAAAFGGKNISVDGVSDDVVQAALKTYVPPGQLDEYYMFASGGHSGNVFVYGVPSMRRIRTIPVFTPESAVGYGWTTESKEMLGEWSWGDVHHPALSETKGDYDGRWLFVNDNANSRAARIDLDSFRTSQILDIPNIYGPHSAVFMTPNSEYFMLGSRFAGPIPYGTYSPIENLSKDYNCVLAAVAIDPNNGEMSVGWEVLMPPWSFDLSDAGKLDSEGWAFLTTYNTEEAYELLEVNASQREMDYVVALNWKMLEQAANEGKYKIVDGVKMIDPLDVPGSVYLVPAMKSPHGVDVTPDGKYFIANGKVAPVATVFSFEKFKECIDNKDFQGEERGFPIVNYEKVRVAEVPVGLGPLHTQFDGNGYAYTTLFIDSTIAKWSLDTFEVVDVTPVHYCPGHLCAAEGDTVSPDGKYLVSLNKLAKDKFLSVGPSHPESAQLIDLTTDKMKILMDVPTDPEPHFAQMIKADKITTWEVFEKDPSQPGAVYEKENARIERDGNNVTVYQMGFRSRYYPDHVEVNEGDHVTWYLTNTDFDEDITHGFGICLYDLNAEAQPGETIKFEFVADKAGVYPFYCTNFCSALHQEMQGWFIVKPKGL